MAKVLVLADHTAHSRSACALLTLARRLGEPVAALESAPDDETIRTLGRYGATQIWSAELWSAELRSPEGSCAAAPLPSPNAESADPRPRAGVEVAAGVPGAIAELAAPLPGSRGGGHGFEADGSVAEPAGLLVRGAGVETPSATDLLAELARRLHPAAILIPATHHGQETAARLAIRLDSGIITDAVDLRPGPIAVQRCLAGSYLVESTVVRGTPIITVRPEAAAPDPDPVVPTLHTIAVEPTATRAAQVIATPKPRAARPALDHADIVVAGGRGVGSRAAFAVLADVAEALGAAVAGSHTAAELGWIPGEARVGLTGKTVHPRLYLACGVSGSVRHRAGMQGAKTVVAIGDDPAAPIFKLAELGIVGDAGAILPALLAEIRARTQTS